MTALEAVDRAPDYAEPIEVWRAWRVLETGGELQLGSVIKTTLWPAGEPLAASCLHRRLSLPWGGRRRVHAAPEERCECGIYGAGLELVAQYLEAQRRQGVARVLGRVALWGEVIECERGFRASFAYPVELHVPLDASGDNRRSAADLAEGLARYGVPVELLPATVREAPLVLAEARVSRA